MEFVSDEVTYGISKAQGRHPLNEITGSSEVYMDRLNGIDGSQEFRLREECNLHVSPTSQRLHASKGRVKLGFHKKISFTDYQFDLPETQQAAWTCRPAHQADGLQGSLLNVESGHLTKSATRRFVVSCRPTRYFNRSRLNNPLAT